MENIRNVVFIKNGKDDKIIVGVEENDYIGHSLYDKISGGNYKWKFSIREFLDVVGITAEDCHEAFHGKH
jgi:hypothetical protein